MYLWSYKHIYFRLTNNHLDLLVCDFKLNLGTFVVFINSDGHIIKFVSEQCLNCLLC